MNGAPDDNMTLRNVDVVHDQDGNVTAVREPKAVLHGELYLDDEGEAHFVCHTPDDMTLGDIREARVKFTALLEAQLDRDDECPMRVVHDAPTAPDSFSKEDVKEAVERLTPHNAYLIHDQDGDVKSVREPEREERLTPREENRIQNALNWGKTDRRESGRDVCDILQVCVNEFPDLRVGQIITVAMENDDVFNVENENLARALTKFLREYG